MSKINYKKLEEILKGKKKLAILTHSSPDPDAIGSALGMQLLLEKHFKINGEIYYDGRINHPENKSLINLTTIELNLIDSFEQEKYKNDVILVDTAKHNLVENPLIVIDHHDPEKNKIKAQFKHIDKGKKACVTIVKELLDHYNIKLDKKDHERIIIAMAHGIRSDTGGFSPLRTSKEEYLVYLDLYDLIDHKLLDQIISSSKTWPILDPFAEAIKQRKLVEGGYLISGVGVVKEGGAIASAADKLVGTSGIETAIIYGIIDEEFVIASVRAVPSSVHASELAQDIFGKKYAGGHRDSAGAKVPLTYFGDVLELEEDEAYEVISRIIVAKFYKAIKTEKNEK